MVNQLDYSQSVARIRVLENKLVTKNQIERLVDTPDEKVFFEVLGDSAYAEHFNLTDDPYQFQLILDAELIKTKQFLEKNNPFPSQLNWLWLKYDFQNIKFALKNKLAGKDTETKTLSPLGALKPDVIIKAVYKKDKVTLPAEIQAAVNKAETKYEKNKNPQEIDVILDKNYFSELEKQLKVVKSKIIKDLIKSKIDLYNLKQLLRSKQLEIDSKDFKTNIISGGSIDKSDIESFYQADLTSLSNNFKLFKYQKLLQPAIEYLKEDNSFMVFEKLSYDYILDQVRHARYEPFGVEPLVGFFMAKDNEAKLIRIIMIGKLNNMDRKLIHQQLRKLYLER